MKLDITSTGDSEAEITMQADEKDLEPVVRQVFNSLRPNVSAKGFRPGRAPNEIVEKELGQERVHSEVIEAAAQRAFRDAVTKHELRPLSQPQVALKSFTPYSGLELSMTLDVMPDITLADYKDISLQPKPVEVTDEEVERVIEGLQLRSARRQEVTRAAKKDDEVVVDFDGKRDGQPVPGANGNDYPVAVGFGRFIDEFEKELVGLKPGEEKEFTVNFPKDYKEAALQGKQITFHVTVKKIHELTLPELDDTFAKELGSFDSFQQLREDVRRNIRAEKEQAAEREFENEVVQTVVEKSKVPLPPRMVEQQLQHLQSEIQRELSARGLSKEDYLKQEGKSEADLEKELTPEAEQRVKTALVLTEIAKQEELDVTPEEVEVRKQMIRGQYQDQQLQAELDKPEAQRELSNQLLTEKTIAKLVEYAKQ